MPSITISFVIFLMITNVNALTYMITGSTSGIGLHTVRRIASTMPSPNLIIHGRKDEPAGLIDELTDLGANSVKYFKADLSDIKSVEALGEKVVEFITSSDSHLDVLVNNAGEFDPTVKTTPQGYETTWAVNVLAPYILTSKVKTLLLESARRGRKPRLITTSSISQSYTMPPLEELGSLKDAHTAYEESKLGDRMLTVKFAELLPTVKCLCMDPGTVNTKMLLSGWGACGIPVDKADNTFKLAATEEGDKAPTGSYLYGGRGSADADDPDKVNAMWNLVETQASLPF
ncbi:hypothetical protein TrCOL_g13603 [Triparma columacea]|uniref:NAD(P)-binding protein n=1 Tax=Triparma columacea TaxID=722753 RepID=A0A9W7LCG1_9STRA|nr:hypothetical protein TrCOL_g13603 [Triparma columacea]